MSKYCIHRKTKSGKIIKTPIICGETEKEVSDKMIKNGLWRKYSEYTTFITLKVEE